MQTSALHQAVAKRLLARDAAGAHVLVEKNGDQSDCRVHALHANIWEFEGKLREAERSLRRAARKFPREPFVYMALGEFCHDHRTKREAIRLLARWLEMIQTRDMRGKPSPLGEEFVRLLARAYGSSHRGLPRIATLARGLFAWPASASLRTAMLEALKAHRVGTRRRK